MDNVDQEILRYLARFSDKRYVDRDSLEEIRSHLVEEIDQLMATGMSPQEAFNTATRSFGESGTMMNEYLKIYEGKKLAQVANFLSHYFNRRLMMRIFFGMTIGLALMMAGVLLEGGDLHIFMQFNAALVVAGGACGSLFVAYPLKTVFRSLRLAVTGIASCQQDYLAAAKVFRSLGDTAILSGFAGLIFGAVHVLRNLSTPDNIGLGASVALMSVLYGLLIKLFIGKPLEDSFLSRAYPDNKAVEDNDGSEQPGTATA